MQSEKKGDAKDPANETGAQYRRCGVLPKYVMLTPDLTAEAKAVYAYLRSRAGDESVVSLDMKTVKAELGMSGKRFRSYSALLLDRGYIREKRERFWHTVYTFAGKPRKQTKKAAQIYVEWKTNGGICGIIPQSVMADSGVSIMAKALYAYLSVMGNTPMNTAKVTKWELLEHMGITDGRYQRYCRELVAAGYMTVVYHRYVINEYLLHESRIQTNQDEDERECTK